MGLKSMQMQKGGGVNKMFPYVLNSGMTVRKLALKKEEEKNIHHVI